MDGAARRDVEAAFFFAGADFFTDVFAGFFADVFAGFFTDGFVDFAVVFFAALFFAGVLAGRFAVVAFRICSV